MTHRGQASVAPMNATGGTRTVPAVFESFLGPDLAEASSEAARPGLNRPSGSGFKNRVARAIGGYDAQERG